jgi:hypothetical protein
MQLSGSPVEPRSGLQRRATLRKLKMPAQQQQHLPDGPPVPNTVIDLINARTSMRTRTLNDDVEDAFLKLWEDVAFKRYFVPIWRSQTIEGSFIADEICAVQMLRAFAKENNMPIAREANIDSLQHSLRVVAKRYGLSRRVRQASVGGEIVENGNGEE